ncbi:MAG: cupin domain-containing protein [Longimicrobiales bacterium]
MLRITTPTALLVSALIALPAAAQDTMEVTAAASLKWTPAEVEGFDPGMMMAVVHGDPSMAGQPYTLRLRFPDGYRFPAHWHPVAEDLTVLEGTFHLAMEGSETGPLQTYGPGDYLHIPAENAHSGGATGETVVQLHGIGPFQIMLGRGPGVGSR